MYADIDAVDINVCNQALMKIGAKRITAFDDATVEARDCSASYATSRDQVLEAFPWSFAKRRSIRTAATDTPAFGYSYQYVLPSDCLKVLSIQADPSKGKEPDWTVEGNYLLTNEEEVFMHYTARVEDATHFSPSFIRALSLYLAAHFAMSISKSAKLANELEDKYIRYIEREAMVINARQSNETTYQDNAYVDARS